MKRLEKTQKILLVFTMLWILSAGSAVAGGSGEWRKDKLCGRKLADFQAVAALQGCTQDAYCAQASAETRICACVKSEETGESQLTLEYKGEIKKQWTIEIMPSMLGPESLRLDGADLDGDGKDELLLGAMLSQSNGIGIQYWTVWAITGEQVSEPLEIQDYGTMGFATHPKAGGGCRLLVSRWINGWEPKRGEGLYIAGRWYEFANGEFFPSSERPAVYRRYLFNLEQLRLEYLESQPQKPLLWYTGKEAVPVVGPYPIQ